MPRRKRNPGDIDGRASSPQFERTNEASLAPPSGATPRKSKRTRIVSPQSSSCPNDALDDSASSLGEETALSQSDYSTGPLSVEPESELGSSIPPHIRRLIKGNQVQRHTSSSSGFINMTCHRQPLSADSDTDESSFWSAGDTSLSSTSSALLSDTSMSVKMDVVRFDWPGSPSKPQNGRHLGPPRSEADSQKIRRVRSAPNLSPDRFIPRPSTEHDALLRRSTKSTPRSVRLARHLGFVIGDGPPIGSPTEKFEERLKQTRRKSNPSLAEDLVEPNTSFAQRVMAAGARITTLLLLRGATPFRTKLPPRTPVPAHGPPWRQGLRHARASVFFSRVSGSRLLCIERLCTAEPGTGIQSAVEWGTHAGGWDQALAVGQTKGGISVWDVGTKRHILDLHRPSPNSRSTSVNLNSPSPSQVCAISWNRNLLAAGLNGCSLLWDMRCAPRSEGRGGGEAFKLGAHGGHKVCGVKWRDDGEMLATGGDDNVVCVWDVRMPRRPVLASGPDDPGERNGTPVGQTPMWRKRRHTGAVKALAWCPWAPNILASGGGKQDGTVCFWNVQTGALKETLALGSQITSIAFSPVCREFVTTHGFRCTAASPQAVPSSNPAPSAPPRFQTYDPHPPSDNDLPTPPLQETANSIVTHAYPSLARVAHVPNLHGMRISHGSLSPDGSRLMTGGTFEALVMWSVWGAVGKEVDEGLGSAVGMIR
ncbi:ubiquitin-protein transferase activating protein [Ceratobasidium sp. 370]|nr:ubiquitin-protein transferase activating protein [Ceratobasidium sp. 370]